MRILFVYNTVSYEEKVRNYTLGECASPVTVGKVYEALISTGCEVVPLNLNSPLQLEEAVSNQDFDAAFVIAEGFLNEPSSLYDGSGAMRIREILDNAGVPSTHSSSEAMNMCRNKDATYHMLSAFDIPVPSFAVIGSNEVNLEEKLAALEANVGYPLFVKPVGGGCSICIDSNSICYSRRELTERITMVQAVLENQPVLVEEYLSGREYTVGVLGNGEKYVLPVIGFAADSGVRSAADKGIFFSAAAQTQVLSEQNPICRHLMSIAEKTFEVLGVRDIVRIDIKENSQGIGHVIDVNGTPSLAASGSIVTMAAAAGIEHREVVALVLYAVIARENLPIPSELEAIVSEPLRKLRSLKGTLVA